MKYLDIYSLLNSDRKIELGLIEEAENQRRKILLKATQINDFVDGILADEEYSRFVIH